MEVKTLKEREAEIASLREVRGKVPERNFFGESNLDAIDAQIEVIENGMSYYQIEKKWLEQEGGPFYAARDARAWLDGEWDGTDDGSTCPSESWATIVTN